MVKKILVTGAAGFIGFHLALALKKRGDFVIGCDNFNAYYEPQLKIKRAHILGQHDIECLECDIRDADAMETIINENGITHLVHLAAKQASAIHSQHQKN